MTLHAKLAVISLAAATFLGGCATVEKMDQPTYERLQKQARSAFDKSASVNSAWTTAEDALKNAAEAAQQGDWANAIKLAKKARDHSELAYKQYEAQKNPAVVLD